MRGRTTTWTCSRKNAKSKNTRPVVAATIKKGVQFSSGESRVQASSVLMPTK